jgi:hypothetical protein
MIENIYLLPEVQFEITPKRFKMYAVKFIILFPYL